MTTELVTQSRQEEAIQWLMRSGSLPLSTEADKERTARAVKSLTESADPEWILARIAALLLPYYNGETPKSVRMMEAEDWVAALSGKPQWAINEAVRWWKSDANPKRHKRPVEGDILARVRAEMGLVQMARFRLREFEGDAVDYSARRENNRAPCSKEAAAEIMARAGFAPKRFGSDE